ncbi:F0F1 ATP synthase subunit A [Maridesulfovibrio salexigens]|uniref:ATP synthase subunit a n=1 Tax=Maridesulfovibrio salexigens (strain ATCC 14822 / DSM 2638 / NCIMB 8403 / VKM B-1763) TaxID=526222 RepID=C6BWL0_MARSD|nr:F0F1 ATP synthase subunit A [Maridesulfovibrio salexigens]ACS80290.1 alternate F1F0 ATPase, F0 subunit A [Maridesulfovibrio salexigens DSM 2638]
MEISPDHIIYFSFGFFKLNATIVYTWLVMVLLAGFSWFVTRKVTSSATISSQQNLLEVLVAGLLSQIKDATNQQPEKFLPLLGTLFIFILVSNLLSAVPGFKPPTGSLSTTTAFSLIVFFAVPYYGIKENGLFNYLKSYVQPSPFMLPFNIIGEVSRTFALAVRLFGNILSGTMMGAILLVIMPLFVPVIMQMLGLLIGVVQAYIFTVLAAVFIAAGLEVHG